VAWDRWVYLDNQVCKGLLELRERQDPPGRQGCRVLQDLKGRAEVLDNLSALDFLVKLGLTERRVMPVSQEVQEIKEPLELRAQPEILALPEPLETLESKDK